MSTPRLSEQIDRRAVMDSLQLMLGALPFALVTGIAMSESLMPTWVAWLTSPLIFAGAAQLTVVSLAGTVSTAAVVGALAVVNARHVMYSAALSPAFRRQPRWFRWVGSALIIDQNFALAIPHFDDDPVAFRRYWLSSSLTFYSLWLIATAVGATFGGAVPASWQLQFAVPVLFLALTAAIVKTRPQLVAALTGAGVGLAASGMPNRLGVLVGAVAGVVAGVVAEKFQ